jgi:hypothetical protein
VKTAVPVPMRVGLEPGQAAPGCDGPCASYVVFGEHDAPPASVPAAGFELLGQPSEAWMALGYHVTRAASPARKAPAGKK